MVSLNMVLPPLSLKFITGASYSTHHCILYNKHGMGTSICETRYALVQFHFLSFDRQHATIPSQFITDPSHSNYSPC